MILLLLNCGINSLLSARGPDIVYSKVQKFSQKRQVIGIFTGCVLWLQGKTPQKQPLIDSVGNILLWNGDDLGPNIFCDRKISDTEAVINELSKKSSDEELVQYISSIEGPWSFIYYDCTKEKIYFGRDILGRRSLLWSNPQEKDEFILTSVAKRGCNLDEVPAVGIFCIDLDYFNTDEKFLTLFLHENVDLNKQFSDALLINNHVIIDKIVLNSTIPKLLNKKLPDEIVIKQLRDFTVHDLNVTQDFLNVTQDFLNVTQDFFNLEKKLFSDIFSKAIHKRVLATPPKCLNCTHSTIECSHSKFAVLFSGGLDSALIAGFLNLCLPIHEAIDLVNVSFATKDDIQKSHFNSPDRKSGISSWEQLKNLFPERIWNFIEVNVTLEELQKERKDVINHLIAPQNSVLDDSIGCALYFCGRAKGLLRGKGDYTSPARVLFSGLGADEQCAGYSRHRGRFETEGWSGLLNEIELEMSRISYRNLGRDDRVLSHHGRTVRFPFLDEDVISLLNSLPIWKKANLYLPRGMGEKILLRVVAASMGLTASSFLPKRAIQFGSRIAKLENSKEKGGQMCDRLNDLN